MSKLNCIAVTLDAEVAAIVASAIKQEFKLSDEAVVCDGCKVFVDFDDEDEARFLEYVCKLAIFARGFLQGFEASRTQVRATLEARLTEIRRLHQQSKALLSAFTEVEAAHRYGSEAMLEEEIAYLELLLA